MKGKILQFEKIEDGQYKVTADLSALFENSDDRKQFEHNFKNIEDNDFQEICTLEGDALTYTSETLIPDKYDSKKPRVLIVVGNPATHSIKNEMFYYSQGKKKTKHKFWGKLEKAGLLPEIPKTTREEEADKRREIITGGAGHKDFVIGLTTFYSLPTPTGIKEISKFCDAKGVERLFKPILDTIREEEYERIKSYSFSKGAILVFTQKSSHKFVEGASTAEEKKRLLYWPIMLKNSGGDYLRGQLEKIIPKKH